jgi:hypothetical protein
VVALLRQYPGEASTIRDDLSRKEFWISGMCQKCQDVTFDPQGTPLRGEGEGIVSDLDDLDNL